jgi:hypothetical protein
MIDVALHRDSRNTSPLSALLHPFTIMVAIAPRHGHDLWTYLAVTKRSEPECATAVAGEDQGS